MRFTPESFKGNEICEISNLINYLLLNYLSQSQKWKTLKIN